MEIAKRVVIATFDVVGFHAWPQALSEVSYLSNEHRHVFTVRVECTVKGDDREVEFHMLRRKAEHVLRRLFESVGMRHGELHFGARSCEMIAIELREAFHRAEQHWPVSAIEVWEDGENGARVEFAQ